MGDTSNRERSSRARIGLRVASGVAFTIVLIGVFVGGAVLVRHGFELDIDPSMPSWLPASLRILLAAAVIVLTLAQVARGADQAASRTYGLNGAAQRTDPSDLAGRPVTAARSEPCRTAAVARAEGGSGSAVIGHGDAARVVQARVDQTLAADRLARERHRPTPRGPCRAARSDARARCSVL